LFARSKTSARSDESKGKAPRQWLLASATAVNTQGNLGTQAKMSVQEVVGTNMIDELEVRSQSPIITMDNFQMVDDGFDHTEAQIRENYRLYLEDSAKDSNAPEVMKAYLNKLGKRASTSKSLAQSINQVMMTRDRKASHSGSIQFDKRAFDVKEKQFKKMINYLRSVK